MLMIAFSNSTLSMLNSLQFASHQKRKATESITLKKYIFSVPLLKVPVSSKVYNCHRQLAWP